MARSDDRLTRLDLPFVVRLRGPLDAELLRRSIEELLKRHESLRARIVLDGALSCQYIEEFRPFDMKMIRVPVAEAKRTEWPATLIHTLALRRCDLEAGPLFDATLIHLNEREHLLYWAVNHFIADGWSLNLLTRELWLLYRSFSLGLPFPLDKHTVGIRSYQQWQRDARRIWITEHGPYWNEHLSGAMGIRWPTDPLASTHGTPRAEPVSLSFSKCLTAALRQLARTAKTMLSLLLLTVYAAVISRWCRQDDLIVTMLVHGRERLEQRHVVGFLAHPVYLRIRLSAGMTFIELLSQITDEYRRTMLHKDFGDLVTENWALVSDTHFNWLPWQFDDLSGAGGHTNSPGINVLTGESYPVEWNFNFEEDQALATLLWDSKTGICGNVYYRRESFSRTTVAQYVNELRCAAQAFVESPNAQIDSVIANGTDRFASVDDQLGSGT